jgi:hypothetical protein
MVRNMQLTFFPSFVCRYNFLECNDCIGCSFLGAEDGIVGAEIASEMIWHHYTMHCTRTFDDDSLD